jgi:hypothetical protein
MTWTVSVVTAAYVGSRRKDLAVDAQVEPPVEALLRV